MSSEDPIAQEPPLLIKGLISQLPPPGRKLFPSWVRDRWVEAARVNLDLVYGCQDDDTGQEQQ